MLIPYTPIASLSLDQKTRLKQSASGLLQTNEASHGYVVFEGNHISSLEVRQFIGGERQILKG